MPPLVSKQRDPDTDQPKKRQLMSSAATPPTPQQDDNNHSPDHRAAPQPPLARPNVRSAPLTTIHRRQGDRGSAGDDAAPAQRLPIYVRFADLAAAGIVRNWPTLLRVMDEDGFT